MIVTPIDYSYLGYDPIRDVEFIKKKNIIAIFMRGEKKIEGTVASEVEQVSEALTFSK